MKKIKIFPTNEETVAIEETAVLRNKDFSAVLRNKDFSAVLRNKDFLYICV